MIIIYRDKTANVLEHPLTRPLLPLIPTQIRSYFISNEETERLLIDYDSAAIYLQKWGKEMMKRNVSGGGVAVCKDVDTLREYEYFSVFFMCGNVTNSLNIQGHGSYTR